MRNIIYDTNECKLDSRFDPIRLNLTCYFTSQRYISEIAIPLYVVERGTSFPRVPRLFPLTLFLEEKNARHERVAGPCKKSRSIKTRMFR